MPVGVCLIAAALVSCIGSVDPHISRYGESVTTHLPNGALCAPNGTSLSEHEYSATASAGDEILDRLGDAVDRKDLLGGTDIDGRLGHPEHR